MTARREFSAKVKAAAFVRAAGRCEECTARLFVGKFQYDHRIADALGGEPTLENCVVLCSACHAPKTVSDTGLAAKVKRITGRHIGAHTTRNPMPGSKASKWKRKMNGTTEARR